MFEAYPTTITPQYAIRRADGLPWSADYSKSEPGTSNGEVSEDGMVFFLHDRYDLVASVLGQRFEDNNPHNGDVVPMKVEWRREGPIFVDMSEVEFRTHCVVLKAGIGDWLRFLIDKEVEGAGA